MAWPEPFGIGWGGAAVDLLPVGLYPHNIVLEVFVEAGWLTGVLFLGIFALGVVRAWRGAAGWAELGVLALLAYWTVNALVSGDVNDNRAFFAMLGAALSVVTAAAVPGKELVDGRGL